MYSDQDLAKLTEEFVEINRDILDDQFALRGAQFDCGLAMVHFPEGYGGLGGNRGQQAVIDGILRANGANYEDLRINPIGIGMGAPTLLMYGSEELKAKHIRRIFTGEEIWCQLFSEPTHGSDVAGIPSRAIKDGDEWIVNGQKVWTTLAHVSSYGMLLTRTNPDVPKHKGLSYFVLDMRAPGVEVRPLFQMTGEAEFNEVFLTDVRIHDSLRLGAEGEGWKVAITTLMNERVALSGGAAARGSGPIRDLLALWEQRRDELSETEQIIWRDRVATLWIDAEIIRLTNARAKASAVGGSPGPEGSVGKLASAEFSKRLNEAIVELEGADGMIHEPGYPLTRSSESMRTRTGRFLRSRANTIEGGTSEIMRNILAERVLGLPGDVRVDTELPWSEIPR
jgi:alkylation response protein AidB-like acyl-CoA dehydrogenase